jgi:type IV pilus assembly protein PilC
MPTFRYVVKNPKGRVFRGSIHMDSKRALLERLWEKELVVLSVEERRNGRAHRLALNSPPVKAKELVVFSRQLATMVGSGIPIIGALDVLAEPVKNRAFKQVLRHSRDEVEGGSSLSQAMSRHPTVFSDLFVNMVSAGESSGKLDDILDRLATYLEKSDALRRKVQSSLTYPAVVLCLAFGVTAFLLMVVVPKFRDIFAALSSELPLPTKILLNTSEFLSKYFVIEVALLAVGAFAFRAWVKTDIGRRWFDRSILRLPVFGELFQKVAIARFARTLATLLRSGVPVLTALEIVAKTIGNRVIEEAVLDARTSVKDGKFLSAPMGQNPLFPGMAVRMILVGESTGRLEEMLGKVADFYESEVDTAVAGLTTLIEPLVITVLGVIVGGIAVALLLPVFTLPNIVGGR